MTVNIRSFVAAAVLATFSVSASALARPHSKTIRVEFPTVNSALAQPGAEAMYLYHDNVGQTLLYVESNHGRELTTLDVSDPATIRRIAQTELPTASPYDFLRSVGGHTVLIRYRDNGQVAALCFRRDKHPVLKDASVLASGNVQLNLGQTGLLISDQTALPTAPVDPQDFEVVDTANAAHPVILAAVSGVTQQLSNSETGTLFLLNHKGVTVVRRLRAEAEHQIELDMMRN